ncbi:MAG: NUDIX domain-containing protein [Cumulibacter sp.]
MRDPNDGWADGPAGRFWGRGGAAGLLAHDPTRGVLLQHRVAWSHQGGTWGLPGGARHVGESAIDGALREAGEEAGVVRDGLSLRATFTFDVGYWSYTTVHVEVTKPFEAEITDPESEELRWVPPAEIADMPLHSGFGDAWPGLRQRLESPPLLVIDAANVVGSRPNGWWRDRVGAAERLIANLQGIEADGAPGAWFGLDERWHLWPEVLVVIEGQATAAKATESDRLRVVRADQDGDATIVDEVRKRRDADVVVVTADRVLRERVMQYGARPIGPSAVLDYLDRD